MIEETKAPLIKKVLGPMVEEYAKVLILKQESGLGTMIKLKQYQTISLMFKIFNQVVSARQEFEKFIVETVTEDCNNIIQDKTL